MCGRLKKTANARGRSILFITLVLTACLLVTAKDSQAEQIIPSGEMTITYKQVNEGKISDGYHELRLACFNRQCSLRTITLNQCWEMNPIGKWSFVFVQESSTNTGNLKIISAERGALALEERIGGATVVYRFSYSLNQQGQLAHDSLLDFSGGASKNSDILGKVLTWQLVPLRTTDASRFESLKLDCPIRMAALPGK
jgi:hypothetical protein